MPSSTRIISAFQKIKTYSPPLILLFNEFTKTEKNKIKIKKNNFKFSSVKLQNVSIRYNNSNLILKNISIKFSKNSVNGIYGESGSGKTSLVNVISGLVSPDTGKIFFDNKTISMKRNSMPLIGYVPQDTQIFDDTIWNNITLFKEKSEQNMDLFKKAIKRSNLFNFIYSTNIKKGKEDMILGERGSKISGGQMQRIGIARALFVNPDILIFDEATNSLDSKNEKDILKTIYSLKKDKIIIIISHSKTNLNRCDKIYKIENQKIINLK